MIITIAGQAGSGKSTVAKMLASKLGMRHYGMGDMRRKMAEERGITLAELNKIGEKEAFTDKQVDEYQKQLGKKEDNFVVDGRLSWHFIQNSVKIYLKASLNERAKRVFYDERKEEKFSSMEETKKALVEREKSDERRYKKYYGINIHKMKNYDLVLDTTKDLYPKQATLVEAKSSKTSKTVEKIISFLKSKNYL